MNKDYIKINKSVKNLVNSLNNINRFNLYQFFKESNKQLIDNTSILWNLKGKPNNNK